MVDSENKRSVKDLFLKKPVPFSEKRDILLDVGYVGDLIKTEKMSGEVSGEIGFDYNSDFSTAAITAKSQIDSGVAIQLGYDHDGLLTQAGDLQLKRSLVTGAIEKLIHGPTSQSLSRNNFGELAEQSLSIAGRAEFSIKYERDKLGRVVSRIEKRAGKFLKAFTFSYDEIGRLQKVFSGGKLSEFYVYDANGNRLRSDEQYHFRYDNQDRLIQAGETRYQYNENGDLEAMIEPHRLSKFKYDSFGNLRNVDVLRRLHRHRHEKLAIDYLVDGRNRRVGKKINGQLIQSFIYQSDLQIAAELNRDGRIVKRFVYGSKANVPDYMITPTGKFQILSDQLGSPRLVIDLATGRIVQDIEYDSFGRVLRDTKPGFIPFGFAGGIYDHDTKLIRFGARDYDPETGRWTSKDPILFNGGDTNLYGYVMNDPVNFIDPSGHFGAAIIGAVVFEIAFDATTFIQTYRETGSFIKAWETTVERSPLNNITNTGLDIALGPIAPVFQPLLDPTMLDTIIKVKKHNDQLGEPCPPKK